MSEAKIFWVFNENTCVFQRATLGAVANSFAAVWRDAAGDFWARIDEKTRRWQDGDIMVISGVEFCIEQFRS